MQVSNNNLSFTSVHIPTSKNFNFTKPIDMIESCFEIKGFYGKTPAAVRNSINENQAGLIINREKDTITLVGKDREADEFIARQMKKENIEHTYVQDTPETIFEGPVIDMTI